ncbi:hypothetical protein FACS1894109_11120 [Spirochaetia bacterium]|nr:hypothetical protein FACS1894109_11120 [Spirochaetia bacterium]
MNYEDRIATVIMVNLPGNLRTAIALEVQRFNRKSNRKGTSLEIGIENFVHHSKMLEVHSLVKDKK